MIKKTTQFKQMLHSGQVEFIMEAHNGLSAKIVEETGRVHEGQLFGELVERAGPAPAMVFAIFEIAELLLAEAHIGAAVAEIVEMDGHQRLIAMPVHRG